MSRLLGGFKIITIHTEGDTERDGHSGKERDGDKESVWFGLVSWMEKGTS